jgi:inner membrane protein
MTNTSAAPAAGLPVTPVKTGASPALKFFLVGLMVLLLGIPLLSIYALIWDRKNTASQVQTDIVAGWGRAQNLNGPYLIVPFNRRITETIEDAGKQRQIERIVRDALIIAPSKLSIDAQLAPERRKRTLFESIVYSADIAVSGQYAMPDLRPLGVRADQLEWQNGYILLAYDDAVGLGGSIPRLQVAGRTLEFEPANREVTLGGVSMLSGLDATVLQSAPITFSGRLKVKGSSNFGIAAVAKEMDVRLRSSWPSPSFNNGFLPDKRTVDGKGFDSNWKLSYLALNRPIVGISSGANPTVRSEGGAEYASDSARKTDGSYTPSYAASQSVSAGVSLINPVDLYGQVGRAVKYGFLFLGLTFLVFFLYDVVAGRPISTVAYALVGLALVIFFVLLLAFAEYISFTPAYVLASVACIGLIAAYSKSILGTWQRAGVIAGVLSLLYAFLYVLLQLDEYALLIGSVALFVSLAVLMYATRNVDWKQRRAATA